MKFGWFYLLAIAVTLPLWLRLARRDRQLLLLYLGALLGAMIGAKLAYISVEGWTDIAALGDPARRRDALLRLLAGKSILGGLAFGFLTVELIKKLHGIRRVTGDFFAVVVPLGIAIGRGGCVLNGCCGGLGGWPAPWVELGFGLVFAACAFVLRGRGGGQAFHIYLITYGIFRFAHEFLRATPKLAVGISGYQLWALALAVIGLVAYRLRRAKPVAP